MEVARQERGGTSREIERERGGLRPGLIALVVETCRTPTGKKANVLSLMAESMKLILYMGKQDYSKVLLQYCVPCLCP